MSYQSRKVAGSAIKDPERFYKDPDSVLGDKRLSQAEKDKVLHDWEEDQLALLRAVREDMYPRGNVPSPEEILQGARNAERILENCMRGRLVE
jgi:hypothetical protein